MPLILGTNSIKDTGYDINNSCRFNDGDTAYLSQTISSSTGKIFTLSFWMKKSTDGSNNNIFSLSSDNNGSRYIEIATKSAAGLDVQLYNGSSGGTYLRRKVTRLLRDLSSWMHVCIRFDSTDGTASNRLRIYINGTQATDIDVDSTPDVPEDYVTDLNTNGAALNIGRNVAGSHPYDGYLAEIFFIDGTSLAPTAFGEFDDESPTIFKPKDCKADFTYGTNGFYLDFADSGDLGDDESGQGNDFTENNLAAVDQCTDTPTNNFATANPLNVNAGGPATFAEGNTEVTSPTASGMQFMSSSTLGMTAGKWYCEVKIKTVDSGLIGVSAGASEDARDDYPPGTQGGAESVGILCSNGNRYIDDSGATHGAATSADGIMMIALDLDNNNVYFGTGGNWFDGSGNADESSPNSAISVTAVGSTTDGAYFFSCGDGGGSATHKVQWNFGNPPYANSSSQSDANGYGDFEYSVPSGYLALCTKNLGSDGG